MIAVLNYGVGNINSVINMLKKAGAEAKFALTKDDLADATHLILPGVGHFDACMRAFNKSGLRDIVEEKVFDQKMPVLGICVGHQMLYAGSEEGIEKGLGWLEGDVVKFDISKLPYGYKIPHMSWNDVGFRRESPLLNEFNKEDTRFYFVHSYHAVLTNDTLLDCDYGYKFTAGAQKDNIYGVQFHPEKSHKFGKQLFSNFYGIKP